MKMNQPDNSNKGLNEQEKIAMSITHRIGKIVKPICSAINAIAEKILADKMGGGEFFPHVFYVSHERVSIMLLVKENIVKECMPTPEQNDSITAMLHPLAEILSVNPEWYNHVMCINAVGFGIYNTTMHGDVTNLRAMAELHDQKSVEACEEILAKIGQGEEKIFTPSIPALPHPLNNSNPFPNNFRN
jgi:hypothetical protein